MPQVGETRSANGETRTWSGTGWALASPSTTAPEAQNGPSWTVPGGTYAGDVARYLGLELKGAGKAALGAVDPRTYIDLAKDMTVGHGQQTFAGIKDAFGKLMSGDPETLGGVLGGAVVGKALPSVTSAAPGVARKAAGYAGRGMEAVGKTNSTGAAVAGAVVGGPTGAVAAPAITAGLRGAGRALQRLETGGSEVGGVERYMPNVSRRGVSPETKFGAAADSFPPAELDHYMPNVGSKAPNASTRGWGDIPDERLVPPTGDHVLNSGLPEGGLDSLAGGKVHGSAASVGNDFESLVDDLPDVPEFTFEGSSSGIPHDAGTPGLSVGSIEKGLPSPRELDPFASFRKHFSANQPQAPATSGLREIPRHDAQWGPGSLDSSGELAQVGSGRGNLLYDPQTDTPYLRQQLSAATDPAEREFLRRAVSQRSQIDRAALKGLQVPPSQP